MISSEQSPTSSILPFFSQTRTQIVNEMDASIITLNLDVFPGCVVVESGTGSGCMTLSLARAVAPSGHVYTFEYNPTRAETAREEFKRLGVEHLVTVTCRDVCGKYAGDEGGFSGVGDLAANAVFLDLPEPWLAIDHVLRVLKPGGSLCTYSPCVEQVMKTCERLRESGFHSLRTLEVRQRPFDGR
jgi:tRNA (adenine57-N1/adenine58-N1)-methyltransferase catalytic subunit